VREGKIAELRRQHVIKELEYYFLLLKRSWCITSPLRVVECRRL
jgi:hypothetical protein